MYNFSFSTTNNQTAQRNPCRNIYNQQIHHKVKQWYLKTLIKSFMSWYMAKTKLKMRIFTDVKDKEKSQSLQMQNLRHHLNKKTSETNVRVGCEERNRFKKVYRDFESMRTERQLSHHIRLRSKTHLSTKQTESDNCTPSGISLMKNETFRRNIVLLSSKDTLLITVGIA